MFNFPYTFYSPGINGLPHMSDYFYRSYLAYSLYVALWIESLSVIIILAVSPMNYDFLTSKTW